MSTGDTTPDVMIGVIGAAGSGKSTFVHLLTDDDNIRSCHDPEDDTFDARTACYVDKKTRLSVMLIDFPSFDDTREGISDADILDEIINFLEPENGERRKLNGIIYMHDISNPQVTAISRKNLRMFRALCGNDSFKNVRIVTTHWDRITGKDGSKREAALRIGTFKALIDAGAVMRRHTNDVESGRQILSELIPLKPVTMQIQDELESGLWFEDTTAGIILTAELLEMQRIHERELAELRGEVAETTEASGLHQKIADLEENVRDLRAELSASRRVANRERDKLKKLTAEFDGFQHKVNSLFLAHEQQYQCEHLYAKDCISNAAETLLQFAEAASEEVKASKRLMDWFADFRARCVEKLEKLGDAAMGSNEYNVAIQHYSDVLALDQTNQCNILLKRSKAKKSIGLWEEAVVDANKIIELDPSSLGAYEVKYAALLGAQSYDEATEALGHMLQKLEQSTDPAAREQREQYTAPSETKQAISNFVKRNHLDAPFVLINTETGLLRNAQERTRDFEDDPVFKRLVSSMTKLDDSRIKQTVKEYFRYAMFSHTWEGAEPLFHEVIHDSIYNLEKSPRILKLVTFCAKAREAGLRWAWSDTCCINKEDGGVLQESLTSMFKWYHGSFLTIVHLKGVWPDDLLALAECLWNTRAWTLQEFFASKVIHFYTENWKPYLPHVSVYNHKDSPEIMEEMERATGVDAKVLLSLRPGSEDVRQKLCLAASRVATKLEDRAYSLFGIFRVSTYVVYGEGQEYALGRLLQEVLTRSGDISILAWTGKASTFNSGLPADISVYRESASPIIPLQIDESKLSTLVSQLDSSIDLDSAVKLYDRVLSLRKPLLASQRLTLACIMFPLKVLRVLNVRKDGKRVYHVYSHGLGRITIETTQELSQIHNNLVLAHPWLKCLLDPVRPFEDLDLNTDNQVDSLTPLNATGNDKDGVPIDLLSPSPSCITSPTLPTSQLQFDKTTRALRLFARLKQPFGGLLLESLSHDEYKRVACDHRIVVQLTGSITPSQLIQMLRIIDIL